MELANHTRYPAGIARMVYGDDRIAASVLVRVTYRIDRGKLVPADDQPWIVSNQPWQGPQGLMDGDLIFYKGGVDVFLFGRAVPERGRTESQLDVEITVGAELRRRVRVFGPRVWYRGLTGLVASPPRPFTSIPLTLAYAYGGQDSWDGLPIPHLENPEGMGFYVVEESAVDRPLPCIEEIDHLIARWEDRPPPAGLVPYPPASPLRAKNGVDTTPGQPPRVTPRFFNSAFPPMIAAKLSGGDTARITGVAEDGPVELTLPRHALLVRLRFGDEQHEYPLSIDQVGFEIDEGRVFIAYRFPFRYVVHPLQERSCELFERGFEP